MQCEWHSASYLIFSENVAPLIYYSHLGPLLASLLLGGFVLFNNRRNLASWVLFFVTLMFAVWAYFDLILWASPSPEDVIFFWSSIIPIELLIYAGSLYLVFLFANGGKDISLRRKLGIGAFFIPIILLLHTPYTVTGLSPDCDEGAIEGIVIQYMYIVEIGFILMAAIAATRGYFKLKSAEERHQLVIIATGVILFLLAFTAGNITLVFALDPVYEQYKLFGMPILLGFLSYSIIRFKTFNVKLITAQVLVTALGLLTLSLLFLRTIENVRVVTILTLVLVCVLGYILVRNVRTEIAQRERVEKLAKDLETANERLKEMDQMKSEFLSIASHQLRAPITAIKGYVSLIREGDYGAVPEAMKEPLSNISESVRVMVSSIDDYLNVSRIEQNRMKYEISDVDIADIATKAVSELQPLAQARKLTLSITAPNVAMVRADIGKIKQVITNLIDNAIKYTKEGSVAVSVEQGAEKIRVTIADTGVGISAEDIGNLFQKFKRAAGANEVNTAGTGLGLYVARLLVEGHGGKVWAESEGKGKGSRFIVELPLMQKTPATQPASSKVIPPPPRA